MISLTASKDKKKTDKNRKLQKTVNRQKPTKTDRPEFEVQYWAETSQSFISQVACVRGESKDQSK